MKLLKRSLVLLGCALAAAAAFTACELELGNNDDRKETADSENPAEVTVPDPAAAYALDGTDDGVKIEGNGSFVEDNTFGTGKVFKNDDTAQRTSYLLLPKDTLQHSAESKEMTIGFWVNANGATNLWNPLFSAYAAAPSKNEDSNRAEEVPLVNGVPMFILQSRCQVQVNIGGEPAIWCDFIEAQKDFAVSSYGGSDKIWNVGYNDWKDNDWHYYTCTMTEKSAVIYIDGEKIVSWTIDGTTINGSVNGIFQVDTLTYVCLGGNQAWDWGDADAPYSFAKFSVWDTALNEEQIKSVVAAK